MHCILDITPSISDTTSTISVSSRPVYQLNHTNTLYDITHYVWHHSQYAWHHMNTSFRHTHIGMTSQRVYLWHHNTVYDINATAFMKIQWLYLTSHPLYLTSKPLYLCCNIRCIVAITTIMEVIPLGTRMTSYTLYMTSQSHFMTSFLSIYNITATAFMTSDSLHMTSPPGFMTSCPLYLWHHIHYVCEYMSTIFNIKHRVLRHYNHYLWNHNFHMCISVTRHTLSMI